MFIRPNPPPPLPPHPSLPNNNKKTKRYPPQETINKIWQRFSVPQFSKATTILPSAPPTSSDPSKLTQSRPTQNSLLVSEDFQRAVQKCRTKVQKLIKECKRVNMRYRDPSFDIDWDLKLEKGYCLNGLIGGRFELNSNNLSNWSSQVPKAVKRVHEIFEKPTFLGGKNVPADVKLGNLGDCWLIASLTALVNIEFGIERICVVYDTKIGIYGFVFHRDGEWIIFIGSPSVQHVEKKYRKTHQTGSQALFFAHCKDPNETWLPLLEKAYAKAHGDYTALGGGVTTELLTSDILDTDEFWKNEIMKVNKELLFGCSTGLLDGSYSTRDGISDGHAYAIIEARELSTGQRLLKLRNPWGKSKKGNWEGPWSDSSKEFTPEAQLELNYKFGNDSAFWILFKDLLHKYQHLDRTRLFMDSPDWHITQKWISAEVPWLPQFKQRFRIALTKESPVVLVLSQLDDRYLTDFKGQYSFRLQFRMHDIDSPGDKDYIVRSHRNYLMERSVATELPSLPAGTYSVFVQVTAHRDTKDPSVEDVVKAQLKRKVDNDKLAQVGAMYNLAHSKGAAHLEAKHLTREILRKQDKKNQAKQEAKEPEKEPENIGKEAKKLRDQAVQTEEVKQVLPAKEDKGIQTEEPSQLANATSSDVKPANDRDKAVQTENLLSSSTMSQTTPETPNFNLVATSPRHFNCYQAPTPLYNCRSSVFQRCYSRCSPSPPSEQYFMINDESSASPISDFDDFHSDDDLTLNPRLIDGGPNDNEPEPWNAVCIIGFKIYSKDQGLEAMWDSIEELVNDGFLTSVRWTMTDSGKMPEEALRVKTETEKFDARRVETMCDPMQLYIPGTRRFASNDNENDKMRIENKSSEEDYSLCQGRKSVTANLAACWKDELKRFLTLL
ncbi:hypothetical protein B0O99DRAFT_656874 [Bisporella sp. PMI_857]|nr:hypothetical protein B0O99DRAFT_656874 [Bisporella sp. PMI_857]